MLTRKSAPLLAAVLFLVPASALAQTGVSPYRYTYDYGFTQGQYPYYSSPYFHRVWNGHFWVYYPNQQYAAYYRPGTTYYTGPTHVPVPPPPPAAFLSPPAAPQGLHATLDVELPDPDAVVWIDGHRTKQAGTQRQYVSPPLQAGQSYRYEVRAEWTAGGRKVEQTQTVTVRAGEQVSLFFATPTGSGR
ncbi:MAG TPA: TIGR03000 domain-containing protein [Gemmataceae bacterium]|nr:TIGR03000 domain-containing protein [Gemmataceae bacterium]